MSSDCRTNLGYSFSSSKKETILGYQIISYNESSSKTEMEKDGNEYILECSISNGKLEGDGVIVNEDGIIVAKMTFKNGLIHGSCKEYDDYGILTSTCYYRDGKKDKFCYFYENGLISKISTFENGDEIGVIKEFVNGKMIEFDENHEKIYVGGFADNIEKNYCREGEGKEYDGGRAIYIGGWKDNKRNGFGRVYKNGELKMKCEWVNGRTKEEDKKKKEWEK